MPTKEDGFFSAKDNLRLYWESQYPDGEPRAHVAVVHGYADHTGRYQPPIKGLVKDGFAVHAFDYRGHGKSDGKRGHCDRFSEFLDDLELFFERVKAKAGQKKIFVLAHSHGALMSIHFLTQRQQSGVAGLVLSAPYLKLAITPPALKVFGAKLAGKVIPWLPVKNEIGSQDLSRDVEVQRAADADPLYNKTVTPRWFDESNKAQVQAMGMGKSLRLPLFHFVGSADKVASPEASRTFFETVASSDKRFKEYPEMRHEPMNEVGKEQVIGDISGWISAHL